MTYVAEVLADSPIRYFRMGQASGTEPDETGSAAVLTVGTLTASPTRDVAGALASGDDGAMQFDGSNDFASVPLNLSALTVLTVECWLKWTTNGTDDDFAWEFTTNANSVAGAFNLDYNAADGASIKMRGLADSRWTFVRPTAGVFHHLVVIMDRTGSGTVTVYVDNVPVTMTERQVGGTLGNFANDTLYLMSRAGTALFGAGVMDELAVYSGALSSTRIGAHYTAGTTAGGHSLTPGTAAETDAAQPLGKRKRRSIGAAAETETAIALGRAHRRALGIAANTETAQPIGHRKVRALGVATEADAAVAITRGAHVIPIGTAVEGDAAQAVGCRKARTVGAATETDAARALAATKIRALGLTAEADAAQPIGHRKARALGTATEGDQAPPITRFVPGVQTIPVGTATETEQAQTVRAAHRRAVGTATETGAAQPIGRRKMRAVTAAVEVDVAQTLARAKRRAVGLAAEADGAGLIRPAHRRTAGSAPELDVAQAIRAGRRYLLGVASEADAALRLGNPHVQVITVSAALETDIAGSVVRRRPPRPDGPPGTGRIAVLLPGRIDFSGQGRIDHGTPGGIA